MDTKRETLFEAASQYAADGYRVFPVNAGKRPLIKGWPKLATTDSHQIRQWWSQWPSANIGIATGESSGLLVLDIDCKGEGNGYAELEAFEFPVDQLEAPRYQTPSGGAQLWFSYPAGNDRGIVTKAHIGGLSIDTRANGGFCLCPPSKTADGRYEWILEPEEFEGLPACPADLLELLREPGRAKGSKGGGQPLSVVADAEGHTLESHPGAGEGLRNGLLVVLVGRWLSDHPIAEWDELEPLVIGWNNRCQPPKPAAMALEPARYLWEKEQTAPKLRLDSLPTASGPSKPATPQTTTQPSLAVPQKKLVVRSLSQIKSKPVRWLWKNHLQIGGVNILAGPPGQGKSTLAGDFAARVSTGTPWPDGTPCPRGKVLVCSAEEEKESTLKPRLVACGADVEMVQVVYGLGIESEKPEEADHIDLERHLPAVYEHLKADGGYLLCIWDTFQSCALQTDHRNSASQKVIVQPLATMAEELGLCQLTLEHYSRGRISLDNPDNAILGSGLHKTARAIWHCLPDPDDDSQRLLLHGKLNNSPHDAEGMNWAFRLKSVDVGMDDGSTAPCGSIDWLEASSATVRDTMAAIQSEGDGHSGRPSAELDSARQFLLEQLTTPTKASELKEMVELEPFSFRTLQTAAIGLGIQKEKPAADSAEAIAERTGLPVDSLPAFDGKSWWWFPPAKLVTELPTRS
ncbi:MAG: bifunctional DNA primase/polymerase [Planctomycetaceae bacterium]|nr:bifunctional DNA primase/polymerase [Planctomycetaceae bacterium]